MLGRRHEVLGILFAAATLLVALSLASYDARGGENWIGPVGSGLAGVLFEWLGGYGPVIWLVMSLVVIPFLTKRPPTVAFRWWVQLVGHFPFVKDVVCSQ